MRTQNPVLFLAVVLVTLLGLILAVPVQADIAASAGPGQGYSSNYDFGTNGWTVTPQTPGEGAPGDYFKLYLDPSAGPWLKNLQVPVGLQAGDYALVENLQVAQPPAWTDYHEFIDPSSPAGWSWVDNKLWSCTSVNQPVLAGSFVISAANVDWFFNPAANVNTQLTLTKYLHYDGLGGGGGTLVIGQYPTPEPAMIVLLIMGALSALGFGWCRRHRS